MDVRVSAGLVYARSYTLVMPGFVVIRVTRGLAIARYFGQSARRCNRARKQWRVPAE